MPSLFFLKDTVKTTFSLLDMCSYSNDALKERIIIDGIDFVFVENCLQFAWMFYLKRLVYKLDQERKALWLK